MKIDEAVSILRAHNEWRRAQAHLPEDAMPAMGDPRQIGIAIDVVCDALSKPVDWTRALRLADEFAALLICNEGQELEPGRWKLTGDQVEYGPHLQAAFEHLEWRGIARAVREDGRVTVIFEEQT